MGISTVPASKRFAAAAACWRSRNAAERADGELAGSTSEPFLRACARLNSVGGLRTQLGRFDSLLGSIGTRSACQ